MVETGRVELRLRHIQTVTFAAALLAHLEPSTIGTFVFLHRDATCGAPCRPCQLTRRGHQRNYQNQVLMEQFLLRLDHQDQ